MREFYDIVSLVAKAVKSAKLDDENRDKVLRSFEHHLSTTVKFEPSVTSGIPDIFPHVHRAADWGCDPTMHVHDYRTVRCPGCMRYFAVKDSAPDDEETKP